MFSWLWRRKPQVAASLAQPTLLDRMLALATPAQTIPAIAALAQRPEFAPAAAAAAPETTVLAQVVQEIYRVTVSLAPGNRSLALNRAQGLLFTLDEQVLAQQGTQAQPLARLVRQWRAVLLQAAAEAGADRSPVAVLPTPYFVGGPHVPTFVGREDLLRELAARWTASSGPANCTILYGCPGVGLTALLHQAARRLAGQVALARLDWTYPRQTDGEFWSCLADRITEADVRVGPSPETPHGLDRHAFQQFYAAALARMGGTPLVLAVDNYEAVLAALSLRPQTAAAFVSFLRQHMQGGGGVVLTGLVPPPVTSPVRDLAAAGGDPLRVALFTEAETAQLLRQPSPDFPLQYADATVTAVWQLTAGHPQLVQLAGAMLVSQYNDARWEHGATPRVHLTGAEGAEALAPDAWARQFAFLARCPHRWLVPAARQVWWQLAADPKGKTAAELLSAGAAADADTLAALLSFLSTWQGITPDAQGRWRITIELFRQQALRDVAASGAPAGRSDQSPRQGA